MTVQSITTHSITRHAITLHLSDAVMRRATQAASMLQAPVEEILASMLAVTLPDTDDAPVSIQTELARMTWLSDQTLWQIAHQSLPMEQAARLKELSAPQAEHPLSPANQAELDALRQEYGRYTLRKARAYALLSLRGGRPLLVNQ
ncbi:MAG: hypothetical protein WAW03_20420 [Anaerolineae bacterium]|uniref:hypothetical protein n=1 Tax=Candidatus Amarolinea dominans TaxID=3140696 RepID=UPI001DD3DC75|nr:hypothetical protein [Anaerolineae bacterium]MBK7201249.1 hypothetical protein [Anaerolineae bacterium]MBK9094877.1 hypothetical protein [Anaerolineae bacterium]MBK9229609.1 hypothetical protein [Anaerolineae bacterium]